MIILELYRLQYWGQCMWLEGSESLMVGSERWYFSMQRGWGAEGFCVVVGRRPGFTFRSGGVSNREAKILQGL